MASFQAQVWAEILKKGNHVWVSEGGQSDLTADIAKAVLNLAPGVNLKNIHVVQNSESEANKTNQDELRYVKNTTDYILIEDGNKKNKTANLNHKPQDRFLRSVRESSYKKYWDSAFKFLENGNSNLDFSDTVNLLYILQVDKDDVGSMIGFADEYF